MKLVTIGAYGFTETTFFSALQAAGVDTFCDLRWRRGVRGAEYVFANRARLERRLAELGIRYRSFRELAAPPALRQQQYAADRVEGTTKRKRLALGEAFIAGYRQQCLAAFDTRKFFEQLGSEARVVALFCVEREPAACHRSLVAEYLFQQWGPQTEVAHLRP